MRVVRSLAELSAQQGASVVTVGNFDGVHCGHRMVIKNMLERGRALDARSVAVTFDPHPAFVLGKDAGLKLITPLPRKLDLLADTGIDLTLVLPFTRELSRWTAREFAERVLCNSLRAIEVHEGETFRFGCQAEAGTQGLEQLGHELCFSVRTYEPKLMRGSAVSSSRIRSLIEAGDVGSARVLLGKPFAIESTPAPGRGYGARYAVPTINLSPYAGILPANGVYVTLLRIGAGEDWKTFRGVTNVGNRPTFGADSFAVESHLLDFQPIDLTESTPLELTFLTRLREERRFPSPEALRQQISRDVARAERYFRLAQALGAKAV